MKDYEKKYKEALERAKKYRLKEDLIITQDIFPELKESEDERIRKEIISAIKEDWPGHTDWIAWIEKQEQKPTELAKGEDYGIDGLYAAIDILQQTLGKVDGYQSDDGILEHKCAISAVKKLYEQKPAAWSEEDEEMIRSIFLGIEAYSPSIIYGNGKEKVLNWLKSLRPQNTWKPSDEQLKKLKG